VFTSRNGEALDAFYVQDVAGDPFGSDNPRMLQKLVTTLEAAARGETATLETRRPYELGRAAAFSIAPSVAVDNDSSDHSTVIEASGRDRAGLMEALARILAQAGLSIQSAHIENYGERAVDAFYVQTLDGGKLTDAKRIATLKASLLVAIDLPDDAARSRLHRARASAAR
jgi:[protein-PII] uridylyltransferase